MLPRPATFDGAAANDRHRRALEELLAADLVLEFSAQFVSQTALTLARFDPADTPEAEFLEELRRDHTSYDYLEASADVEVDVGAILTEYPTFAPSQDLFAYLTAVQAVGRAVRDLTLAANLAKPGAVEIAGGICIADGSPVSHTVGAITSMLTVAVEEIADLGWPVIQDLSIGAVWRWMRELPGFDHGSPGGRGGRALAAFSYQLKGSIAENSPMDLVWALVGLEALYGKGKEGLRAQLIEKSQALLGKPHAFRKRFHGMYDYRSRFVHGDLDLPLSYQLYTGSKATSTFESESDTTLTTAVAVLVASLQELVVRGWAEPHFTYVVGGGSAPDT